MAHEPPHPAKAPDRNALGRLGEEAAARHLAARGYQIVARNVRADRVEIDLIARCGSTLAFVEVKTRRGGRHGLAAEAVDPRKQRRLRHGAIAWLAARPEAARGAQRHRFDVVTCVWIDPPPGARDATRSPEPARWSIEHWEGAF
jgi:putative endonuclease